MPGRRKSQYGTAAFLTAELLLYLGFLWLDLGGDTGAAIWLKYAGILLCAAVAAVSAARGGDRLLLPALLLTAVADTLLLVMNAHYAVGVGIFLVVQLIYLIRLAGASGGRWLPGLRLGLPAVLLLALWEMGLFEPLNALAAVYFSLLLGNVIHCVCVPAPWSGRFGAGLALFACCDLCVGLYNSPELIPDGLYGFARIGMWLFYLPAQVLIVLSGFPKKKE